MRLLTSITTVLTFACGVIYTINGLDLRADDNLEAVKERFVGHYELVSFIQFPNGGGEVDANYIGRLTYDDNGHMSGLGMPKDLPERSAQQSQQVNAGFAYWGDVSFDLSNGIVIHHVKGSPTRPQWVGGDNIRYFEFTDEFLKLSLKNSEGRITSTLTWRKIGGGR